MRPREWARLAILAAAFIAVGGILFAWSRPAAGSGKGARARPPSSAIPDTSAARAALPADLLQQLDALGDRGRFPQFTPSEWEAATALLKWVSGRPDIDRLAVRGFSLRQFSDEAFRRAVRGVPLHVEGILKDFREVDLAGTPGFYAYVAWKEPGVDAPSGCMAYLAEGGVFRTGDPVALDGAFFRLAYTFNAAMGERIHQPVLLARRLAYRLGPEK